MSKTETLTKVKTMAALQKEALEKLETEFVDKYGLSNVLASLADICGLKAEWVEEHWQAPLNASNCLGDAWSGLYVELGKVYHRLRPTADFLQGHTEATPKEISDKKVS